MKQILVPTDFSKIAERAYPIAAKIAKATDSKILFFYIHTSHIAEISNVGSYSTMVELSNQAEAIDVMEENKAEQYFKELINSPLLKDIDVGYEITVSTDLSTEKDILKFINNNDHSLVIMGTEGDEQKDRHVSEYIARHTLHPVITINNDDYEFAPEYITICTDFKTISNGFVQRLKTLGNALDAQLKFLYVNNPKDFKDDKDISREVNKVKHKFGITEATFQTINAYNIEDGILDYLENSPKDIIAFCTHGRTGISHFLYGSQTEDMIVKSPVPVYSYNLHKYLESLYGHEIQPNYTRGFTG